MNYRHAYHAGGFTDVVKHAVLALILGRFTLKPTPIYMLDSHAGIGRYDLLSAPAQKTGEYRDGILKVIDWSDAPAALAPYLRAVRKMNKGESQLRWYPGSPGLALDLMRAGDRLDLVELHPEDARDLMAAFARERRANVHASDGYLALKAFLPPRERCGLVLIDPPYEASDEFTRLVRGLKQGYRRWRTGVFAIWYPIKHRAPVAAFHAALVASGIRRITIAELLLRPDDDPERLNGCGLVLVNLPWRLDTTLSELLPALSARFGASPSGGALVKTLVPE